MESTNSPISRSHSAELYSKLNQIDPAMAVAILLLIQATISFCKKVLLRSSSAAAAS